MEGTLVLGIDAGSTCVAAAVAEIAEGEPQVIGVALVPCIGIRKGTVVDLTATAQAIRQAADQACEMASKGSVTSAVIGISGPHIQSLICSAEVGVNRPSSGVTPEDVRRVLEAASAISLPPEREVVHVVPRAYQIDGADGVIDPVGLAGRSLTADAHLIIGDRLPIQNHFRAVAQAELEVADYQLAIRAAGAAVLTPQEREAGVLLLDIGGGTTGVAVYERGYLWHMAILPVGSEHITSDIATVLRTPLDVAERLKVERGWATANLAPEGRFELATPSGLNTREVEEQQLARVIESRVHEILSLAAAQVKRSGYAGLLPAGVVLTGGGSRLQGLVEAASDCLNLPARLGAPAGPLADGPEFATAVGLVRMGMDKFQDEAAAAAEVAQRSGWSRIRAWFQTLWG